MPSSSPEPPSSAAVRGATGVRWGLAALWVIDGLLQLQPALLGRQFGISVLYPAALMYQPVPLRATLLRLEQLAAPHALPLSLSAAVLQLAIGVGILLPRTRRLALGVSVVWALLVWVGGEGLGFMATGTALLEFGAPGTALMYAVMAWVVWPARVDGSCAAALGRLGERGALWCWSVLWVMGAALHFQPPYGTGAVLAYNLQSAAQDQPGALAAADYHLAAIGDAHGLLAALLLALVELAVGVLVWRRGWRNLVLELGSGLMAAFWVLGQAMGGLFSGTATDLSTAPLVILLAISLWAPRTAADNRPAPSRQRSAIGPAG